MTDRPGTARSEISSAISDGADPAGRRTRTENYSSPPTSTVVQHGYQHLRGVHSPDPSTRLSPALTAPTSTSSRPNSPFSNRNSTHVPSITAHAFLRPMSSSRLQAQRSGREEYWRPSTATAIADDAQSLASSNRTGPYVSLPRGHHRTPSMTTGYAESEAVDRRDGVSRGAPSISEPPRYFYSDTSYSGRRAKDVPNPLNLSATLHVGSIRGSDMRSPRSLRSGFSLGSKHYFEPGHQHLPSNDVTPRYLNEKTLGSSRPDRGKNYEYFQGNTIFWWGGRLQNSRDRPVNVATFIVILLPTLLFFVFSASYLWHNVSPAIPFFYAYIFFICASSFLHASLVDPGIIPRNLHPFPPDSDDPLEVGPPTNDWVMVRLAGSDTAAMDVPVKFCKTCNIWRPPRCYHCRVCDSCIETLDHHCVWINNCVGRRNYRYFFTFVSSGTILGLLLSFGSLGHCIAYSNQHHVSFGTSVNVNRVPLAMFVYGIIALAYPLSLWIYHLLLVGKGETTREYLSSRRFPKEERHRPFNLGNALKNWVAVLARPRPPTYLHFKYPYEEGDQRLGSRRVIRRDQGAGVELKTVKGQKGFVGPLGRKILAAAT